MTMSAMTSAMSMLMIAVTLTVAMTATFVIVAVFMVVTASAATSASATAAASFTAQTVHHALYLLVVDAPHHATRFVGQSVSDIEQQVSFALRHGEAFA